VKEHYSNVRANVWFDGLDRRNRGRVMVSAELPLLYPLGRSKSLPDILNTPRPVIGKPFLAQARHSPTVSPKTGVVRLPDHSL